MPKRRIRSRSSSGAPANWQWREGRPRWIPSPGLRKAGWRGFDLKGEQGWLSRGASIDLAGEINAAVAAWRAGQAVLADWLSIAPEGSASARPAAQDGRAIGALMDAYLDSDKFKGLAPKTAQDRRSKLKRFVDTLAGWPALPPGHPTTWPAETFKRHAADTAEARSWSIMTLEPPAFGRPGEALLDTAYEALRDKVGLNMAHGTLAAVSAWLEWCRKKRRAIPKNWAELVERQTPDGRLMVWTWEQCLAFVDKAEELGLHSLGDSLLLGVDLSWSQGDRLAMTWAQITDTYRVKTRRRKTGQLLKTPLLDTIGKPRVDVIRARQAEIYGPNAKPTHVLICELTGAPWKADLYRHRFADVVAAAGLTNLHDQDLRDTAITLAYDAGLDFPEIASRTAHSLRRIQDVIDKHYAVITDTVADRGAGKLNRHTKAKGMKL